MVLKKGDLIHVGGLVAALKFQYLDEGVGVCRVAQVGWPSASAK